MNYLLLIFLLIPIFALLVRKIKLILTGGYVLNLFDGLFLGGVFFVLIPLVFSMIMGELLMNQFDFNYSFDAVKDIDTSVYILFSIIILGIFSLVYKSINDGKGITDGDKRFFLITVFLYVFSEAVMFLVSGKSNGDSHWYSANEAVFQKGIQYVLLGQLHNVGRVVLPAMCIYFQFRSNSGKIWKIHFFIAAIIIFVELFLTGNRIAVLFIIISFLVPMIVKKQYKYIFVLMFIGIPTIKIAQFWPMVRGLIWTEKLSAAHLQDVLKTSYNYKQTNDLVNNGVITATEGINVIFLNYVYNQYPKRETFLLGETLFLKTLGTLVPRTLWESKPEGLGSRIGSAVAPEVDGLVLNATILGDAWANYGYFGILIICIILCFVFRFYRKSSSQAFIYMLFMVSIASWRFDFSFYMISLLTIELIVFLSNLKFLQNLLNRITRSIFP